MTDCTSPLSRSTISRLTVGRQTVPTRIHTWGNPVIFLLDPGVPEDMRQGGVYPCRPTDSRAQEISVLGGLWEMRQGSVEERRWVLSSPSID